MVLFDNQEVESSFTNEEMRRALEDIKKEYPSVLRWFFLWQIHKNRVKDAELRQEDASR